jgi:hypothetical protein
MDMRVEKVFDENGKTLLNKRKLHLLYPLNGENGKKSCQIFSNMKLHDKWKNKDIELKGCNAEIWCIYCSIRFPDPAFYKK